MPYWWGKGWPALSGHWLSCTRCWLYLLGMKWLMSGTLFLHISTFVSMKWLMCGTLFLHKSTSVGSFRKNRWDKLPQTSFIWDWHTILRIISRGVPGLATDSPSSIRGRWMNHLPPVWWSTFRFRFLIVSWCESLIWWRWIILLISCL